MATIFVVSGIPKKKEVACPLWVAGETLPRVEECKCLRVLLTSHGKMEHKIHKQIGVA